MVNNGSYIFLYTGIQGGGPLINTTCQNVSKNNGGPFMGVPISTTSKICGRKVVLIGPLPMYSRKNKHRKIWFRFRCTVLDTPEFSVDPQHLYNRLNFKQRINAKGNMSDVQVKVSRFIFTKIVFGLYGTVPIS